MSMDQLMALVRQRIDAKRVEDDAATRRKQIDAEIAVMMEEDLASQGKETGTVARRLEELGVRLVVQFGVTRSVESGFAEAIESGSVPQWLVDLMAWKPYVQAKAWDALSIEMKTAAAEWVTTKPSSPSIKIEVI